MKRRHKRRRASTAMAAAFFAAGGCMTVSAHAHDERLTAESIAEQDMTCFFLGDSADSVDEDLREIFDTVYDISDDGPLIAELFNATVVRGTPFCLKDLGSKTSGKFDPHTSAIYLQNDGKTMGKQAHISIHEMLHGEQDEHATNSYFRHWDMKQRQLHNFSIEASAKAIEYAIAYDAFTINAEPFMWDNVRNEDLAESFEAAYLERVQENSDHMDALKFATSTIWHEIWTQQSWLDFYNEGLIRRAIRDIGDGTFLRPERYVNPRQFNDQHYSDAGIIGDFGSLTVHVTDIADIPEWDDRFGDNDKMRLAMEYTDLERLAVLYGRDDARYLNQLQILEIDNNPYLGLDLSAIDLDEPDLIAQMDCLIGADECDHEGVDEVSISARIEMRLPITDELVEAEALIPMRPTSINGIPQPPR